MLEFVLYGHNSYLLVNGKKLLSFKPVVKMPTSLVNFALEAYLKNCWDNEVSFQLNVYDFLVDFDTADKSYVLNVHNISRSRII